MGNHYQLLIETPEPNLSKGMRQLNGVYTQRFNRCHGQVGHVFQGRYKAIWVEHDSYLKELARYVVLNSVRVKKAYESGAYTLAQIAGHFGVHYSTVSRAVKQPE
jgi:REP element-mobilizing transposase RayT